MSQQPAVTARHPRWRTSTLRSRKRQVTIVASENPVKIEATRAGFQKMFPQKRWAMVGMTGDSGVSDQPLSDRETLRGAQQRARRARRQAPQADYWVGIEGGVEEIEGKMFAFAWVVVLSRRGTGIGRTASFQLPPRISRQVKAGHELGITIDELFSQKHSKQKSGAIGMLSQGVVDRKALYTQGVIAALIPLKRRSLYTREDARINRGNS